MQDGTQFSCSVDTLAERFDLFRLEVRGVEFDAERAVIATSVRNLSGNLSEPKTRDVRGAGREWEEVRVAPVHVQAFEWVWLSLARIRRAGAARRTPRVRRRWRSPGR